MYYTERLVILLTHCNEFINEIWNQCENTYRSYKIFITNIYIYV